MSKLYDRESGQWVEVDDVEVTPLVASGNYAFAEGLRVPVVFPDGQLGDLPSEKAEAAFRDGGFRWATHQDATAWEDGETARDMSNRYGKGQVGNAAIAGGLRGYTFGLSDAIIPAAAEFVQPGSGAGVKEGLNQLKGQNPISSALAQGAGMVANPLLRGFGTGAAAKSADAFSKVAGSRLAAAEAKLMPEFLTSSGAVNLGTASKLAEGVGRAAVAGAAEGAFFGLSDGVSETALGDPSEVAQNLAAGAGTGALFGGAFGASFGGVKAFAPYLKAAVGKTVSTADDLVQTGLRKISKTTLVPALSLRGEKELADIAGDLIEHPEIRKAYFDGGANRVKEIVKQVRGLQTEVQSEAKGIQIALKEHVRGARRVMQNQINQRLTDAGGDINVALKTTHGEHQVAKASFVEKLKADTRPGQMFDELYNDVADLTKKLRATGHTKAISRANEIETWFNAQTAGRASGRLSKVPEVSEGIEVWMANELRDLAGTNLNRFPAEPAALISKYTDRLTKRLRNHPRFGAEQAKLDDTFEAFNAFRGFITKVKKLPDLTAKRSVLKSMLTDPVKAADFDALVTNFAAMVPEVEAVRLAGKDLVKRQNALNALSAKMDTFRDRRLTRGLDVDDFDEIIQAINPDGDMLSKVDRLRTLSDTLKNGKGAGPVSKLMALQKTLGKPIDKDLIALKEFEEGFGSLESLRKASEPRGPVDTLAKSIMARMGLGAMMGGTSGAIFGGLSAAASNPHNALRVLTRLESISSKSARTLEKATSKAIDVLTKPGIRRGAAAVTIPAANSLEDRRKNFKKRAAFLNSLSDPHKLVAEVENHVGVLEEAPMVSAAMGAHFTKTVQFLAGKLPIDPLAHTGISFTKSSWEPSDVELSTFERYSSAAENPVSVLEDVANGSVTPEQIETLKALYPLVYERLQQGVLDAIMDENVEMSYEQRLNISTLFDVPADPTMTPQFISSMQAQFSSPPSATGANPQQGPSVNINIDPQAIATEVSRLTYS